MKGKTRTRLAQPERVDRDVILPCRLRPEQTQASAALAWDKAGQAVSSDEGIGTLMTTLLPPRSGGFQAGQGRSLPAGTFGNPVPGATC